MTEGTIRQLYIYPVKSLAGIAVSQARVTALGLAGDREWMIVNAGGRFMTQRQLPHMARIQVSLTAHGLRLESPHAGSVMVATPAHDAPRTTATIWDHNCEAQAAPPEVNAWLGDALRYTQPLQLVKFAPGFTRARTPDRFGGATTRFADAAPFLVANQASLDALNAEMQQQKLAPVTMQHFRPNVVADGLPPFAEHGASALLLADQEHALELCDHCQRCSIITVDPQTGKRHPDAAPFTTLAGLNPMPGNPRAPAFGVNARLLNNREFLISTGTQVLWSDER